MEVESVAGGSRAAFFYKKKEKVSRDAARIYWSQIFGDKRPYQESKRELSY